MYSFEYKTSGPLTGDGRVICSHRDLLKQKTRPNTGREFDSRGSTRIVLYPCEGSKPSQGLQDIS
jgi:hypothetical protein